MKPLCEVAISAWEEIAVHLREEAAWRAGSNGIEPASRYKASNSDKQFVLLEADFTVWEAMRNSAGEVYGQREHGDMFEQCEEMVEAGHNALESLLVRAGDEAGPMALESSWPLGGGWREGCHVRLTLRDFRGSFDDVEPLREQEFPAHLKQGSQRDPNKEYLGHVLGQVMAGYEVESVLESGHDPSHDLDLLESTGAVVARVECVSLTSRTGEHWLNTKKPLPQKTAKKLRFNWEARLSLSGPSENKWKALNADPGERKSRYVEFRDKLVKRIIWAESQMGTAVGAYNLANTRRLVMEDPEHEDLARVWLTAEESDGDSGGLSIRADGSSHGWLWPNEGEHLGTYTPN